MGSNEALINQNQCVDRGHLPLSDLTNIKVPKKIANLVRMYCIFNNRKVTEFASYVFEKELKNFKEKIEYMKNKN